MESRLLQAGWREWIELPELGKARIKAKLDTGARTSALHALKIRFFRRDGEEWVRFRIHPVQRDNHFTVECEAPVVDRRSVRSSSGQVTIRPVISTSVRLGGLVYETELTLVNRDLMGFRMLIGRQALRERFLVDSSASFLLENQRKHPRTAHHRESSGKDRSEP